MPNRLLPQLRGIPRQMQIPFFFDLRCQSKARGYFSHIFCRHAPFFVEYPRQIQQEFISDIVSTVDPNVIHAVTTAAFQVSNNVQEVQQSCIVGLINKNIIDDVHKKEQNMMHIMTEILNVRMNKLENRMNMLQDVECMLEGERVALELERRDLYTARCRHWFGGT